MQKATEKGRTIEPGNAPTLIKGRIVCFFQPEGKAA
jgi:hypothetical protein